jgi:hypothetical protein
VKHLKKDGKNDGTISKFICGPMLKVCGSGTESSTRGQRNTTRSRRKASPVTGAREAW